VQLFISLSGSVEALYKVMVGVLASPSIVPVQLIELSAAQPILAVGGLSPISGDGNGTGGVAPGSANCKVNCNGSLG